MLTPTQLESAREYNVQQGYVPPDDFARHFFSSACYDPSAAEYAAGIAAFQSANNLVIDGKAGPTTQTKILQHYAPLGELVPSTPSGLSPEDRQRLASFTVAHEGGKKNPYAGCNLDAEYEGSFDKPKRDDAGKRIPRDRRNRHAGFKPHRASRYGKSGGFHVGLSYGAWQAAQEPGSLGTLLREMRDADREYFDKVFVTPAELLLVTNARGKRSGTRSGRTQPVAGVDLWKEPWVSRFRLAGEHVPFQAAQRSWVARQYLDPALKTAAKYNLNREGDIAVLFDVAIQFGPANMRKYVGRSGLKAGAETTDKSIEKVIRALPKGHGPRRRSILKDAGQERTYEL
jgi:hypothetical protein